MRRIRRRVVGWSRGLGHGRRNGVRVRNRRNSSIQSLETTKRGFFIDEKSEQAEWWVNSDDGRRMKEEGATWGASTRFATSHPRLPTTFLIHPPEALKLSSPTGPVNRIAFTIHLVQEGQRSSNSPPFNEMPSTLSIYLQSQHSERPPLSITASLPGVMKAPRHLGMRPDTQTPISFRRRYRAWP